MTDYVFLDTETTGLDEDAELVEIAILDSKGIPIVDTLLRPETQQEWPDAQAVHGISPDDVADAPTLDEVADEIRKAVAGKTVVIYNADFDAGFLGDLLSGAEKVECAMNAWSRDQGLYKWEKLNVAASICGHKWTGKSHRAAADAAACRTVWRDIKRREKRRISDRERRRKERESEPTEIELNKQERQAVEWLADFAKGLLEGQAVEWYDAPVRQLRAMGIEMGFVLHKEVKATRRRKGAPFKRRLTNAPWYIRGNTSNHYLPFQVAEWKRREQS
jgi:DNA polymerase III epsilon subunit-like protein